MSIRSGFSRKKIGYIKAVMILSLIILGVLGNIVDAVLLYDARLIFGSIATFLIIYFFGPWAGTLTAPLISLITVFQWGHWFGVLIFTAEAAFVGFIYNRRRSSYILLDVLYHILLGIPLVFSISFFILDWNMDWAMLFALTRAFNGIVNVFLAISIVDALQYLRHTLSMQKGGHPKRKKVFSFILSNLNIHGRISFRKALNDFFGVIILVPVLLIIVYISRLETAKMEEEAYSRLNSVVDSVTFSLEEWVGETVKGIESFINIAEETGLRTPVENNFLRLLLESEQNLQGVGITDSMGRVVNHLLEEEYRDLQTGNILPMADTVFPITENEPAIVDFVDSGGGTGILVVIPDTTHNLFVIIGSGDIRRRLYDFVRRTPMDLVLLGHLGQIITSTINFGDSPENDERLFRTLTERSTLDEDGDVSGDDIVVTRNLEGFFSFVSGLNIYGWEIVGFLNLSSQKLTLVDTLIRILLFVFLLMVVITLVSELASKLLVNSVVKLNSVTEGLHLKIERGEKINWPKSFLYEVSSLIKNFQFTVGLIRGHISNLAAANKKLKNTTKEAEAANKAKSQFLATVSHELKTPLNGILGYVQILRNEICTETQEAGLEIIEKSGNHLLTIINDILDVSRIETDKIKIERTIFNLPKFLSEISGIAKILTDQRKIGFRTDFDFDLPRQVEGDERRIRQVLLNLIQNAVKFTTRGFVLFRVTQADGAVTFSVRDTGTGIPKSKQKSIFQPFIQLDNSEIAPEGTGLGLTIVSRLLELMDSEIQIESRLGEGSTFSFTINLAAGESLPADEIDITGPPRHSHAFPDISFESDGDEEIPVPEKIVLETIYQYARKGDIKGILKQATILSAENAGYQKFTSKIRGLAGSFRIKELVEYLRNLIAE
jgi:signal transduction histidine kinase